LRKPVSNAKAQQHREMIDPECHLWGENFSPGKLKQAIPSIQMRQVTEPGAIQTRGKFRGQPAPYGACCIETPEEVSTDQRIEWMADFIASYCAVFKGAGASDIVYWLYWTGVQGNMEFNPRELKKIADLEIPLCIDYIQESQD